MNLTRIQARFSDQLKNVKELMEFDKTITEISIKRLENLEQKLRRNGVENLNLLPATLITTLKTIHDNKSLTTKYQMIYNSCLVLQISYFTSILNDIFKYTLNNIIKYWKLNKDKINIKDEFKFSFIELMNFDFDLWSHISELILQKSWINFQDMQSTIRTFQDYLDIFIERDEICNTIIIAQASRHAIVHSLEIVDKRFLKQINNTKPNNLNIAFKEWENIKFWITNLQIIESSMITFIKDICDKCNIL